MWNVCFLATGFGLVAFGALTGLCCKGGKAKAAVSLASLVLASVCFAVPALSALSGEALDVSFRWGLPGGEAVRIRLDALSAWFVLIISLVFTTGGFYGADYLSHYREHRASLALHAFSYLMAFGSMVALCVLRHSLAFLVAWEIMALSSFVLIVFESWKEDTIKAGINFFIQSHISVVLLTAGFLLVYTKTGSFDFDTIAVYTASQPMGVAFWLLVAGFAIKAGFLPFHTWLPLAHPAAPAHISGVMSGVIIKIGIYGILRMTSLFQLSYATVGGVILAFSAVSGLYGVMLAIVQHNLKKLLAYHSIENIGIIGMGIGLGCIGLGHANPVLAALGFGGALLHTLNHALFKSTLFYSAGNVYHAAHSLNVESLGGLAKRLPMTALFFLVAAVAICGLPPLNGFVSEFLIYSGLISNMSIATPLGVLGTAFALLALVMIGGLAVLCFTKAYGIVFSGTARTELPEMREFSAWRLVPMGLLCAMMLSIGLFPGFYLSAVEGALGCLGVPEGVVAQPLPVLGKIGGFSLCFVALVLLLWGLRFRLTARRTNTESETWSCGYTAATPKIQYTATSFVKTYADLFSGLLGFRRREDKVEGVFPAKAEYESENFDKLEEYFVLSPAHGYRHLTGWLSFLQNGHLQWYILYGIVFIVLAIFLVCFS